ncbi:M48 family metalloprotease [Sagittula sp. MA-2]|uniref:M48 family metalloprotease n=1 Tax=Sagittula sp. MA-2 TaxID=3048007 RepID=UPI0024C37429|nr:M48 family metalloprotease [Sagittula sp. MA-2]WHZ37452.1 M48 family metalloprotease [Sagittula sp. MA-2]
MILTRAMAVLLAATLMLAQPVRAATFLRDADMEYALGQLAAPILSAAGLSPSQVQIVVLDDNSLNAFVADARHIFLHSGLIMKVESAAALQAVIAHEAAHIANGHITRRLGNMRSARSAAGMGMLLALATGLAGADPSVAAGIAFGSQSSAQRRLFSHTRAEESSADIASVRYLKRADLDPQGAVEVIKIFAGQVSLSESRLDPYAVTHPLSRDRLRALEALAVAAGPGKRSPEGEYWFARARGKLSAFKRAPSWTLRRSGSVPYKDVRLMQEAVAWHRQSNLKKALAAIDGAISTRPGDPFLLDLKGQILLESRQFGPAVQVYEAAASRAPREPLILGGLGRARLAAGDPRGALQALEAARGRDFSDPGVLRDLGVTYAKLGNNAMASLATAERYALLGRLEDAELHARRASDQLPRGSAPWQRAQDVLSAAQQAKRR